MALSVLLQTSRVSAEATVERLQALEIDAQVLDQPNLWVKLASAGTYRVRVAVPEAELERARAELARLDGEAGPRVRSLANEVQRVLLVATLVAGALGGILLALGARYELAWAAGVWLAWIAVWVVRSRGRAPEAG
ncbi:MAG: hypothetical protein EXS08_00995 [Planctomycetes bacterium]|nr:hypothetical protein [Planctomycetota bacterium]